MNGTHFIFRIGPVMVDERDSQIYFVLPPKNGHIAYRADDDRDGLTQILRDYDAASLECEPELASVAVTFQIKPGELTPERAQMIAGMAFDLALGDRYKSINQKLTIYAFAIACKEFWNAAPWRYQNLSRPIGLIFEGAPHRQLVGILDSVSDDDEHSFTLYRDLDTVHAAIDLAAQGRAEEAARSISLVVNFGDQPPYAVDAMRRAYGFSRIPIAAKMEDGKGSPLSDLDLLTIGAALKAASALTDEVTSGGALVQVGDLKVEADAHLLDPFGG
jgi:hypothetical protein